MMFLPIQTCWRKIKIPSRFFQANYLRLFLPPHDFRGQIWPHHWLFHGQLPNCANFQLWELFCDSFWILLEDQDENLWLLEKHPLMAVAQWQIWKKWGLRATLVNEDWLRVSHPVMLLHRGPKSPSHLRLSGRCDSIVGHQLPLSYSHKLKSGVLTLFCFVFGIATW